MPRLRRHVCSGAAPASGVVWTTKGDMTPVEQFAVPSKTRVQWSRSGFWCGLDDERRDDSRGAICRAFEDTCTVEPLRLLVWFRRRKASMTPVGQFAATWETRVQWSRSGFWCALDDERCDDSVRDCCAFRETMVVRRGRRCSGAAGLQQ